MKTVLYIAASLDGFIATPDGGVGWLEPYEAEDYGYEAFYQTIGSVVMGRVTYEQVRGFGEWPYAHKQTLVLSHSPRDLVDPPPDTRRYDGPLGELFESLRREARGDVWLVGGGQTIQACLAEGCLDEIILFLMPVLLGKGIPLFPGNTPPQSLELEALQAYANGVVKLVYRRHQPVRPAAPDAPSV
jgi:dihydrofolate reductase